MWEIIAYLWLIPLALGVAMLARVAGGNPAITEEEWQLFFGDTTEPTLSLWSGIKLALLSVLFFFVGVAQGLMLINIGFTWIVLVPLVTALGAILILAWWLRSTSRKIPQKDAAQKRENHTRGFNFEL
jgi:hypothetical protein